MIMLLADIFRGTLFFGVNNTVSGKVQRFIITSQYNDQIS